MASHCLQKEALLPSAFTASRLLGEEKSFLPALPRNILSIEKNYRFPRRRVMKVW